MEKLSAAVHFIQAYKEAGIPDKKREHHNQAERENDNQQRGYNGHHQKGKERYGQTPYQCPFADVPVNLVASHYTTIEIK